MTSLLSLASILPKIRRSLGDWEPLFIVASSWLYALEPKKITVCAYDAQDTSTPLRSHCCTHF